MITGIFLNLRASLLMKAPTAFFSKRQTVDKISQKVPVSEKHKHAFGENSKNRRLMSEKHTFHFICPLFCRFYSNEQCMLKIFFIHIGIMIMLNILSRNVRFSVKAGFHLQWSRSWSCKWSWKNQKVSIFCQLQL